jgi:beta-phosphoglucomutase
MAGNTGYGVIWDMDGTMVDTAELHFQAWSRLAHERGMPLTRPAFVATFGQRNPEVIRFMFGTHFSEQEIHELGQRKEAFYREAARQGVALLPGVEQLLAGLQGARFRQAIGSSAPRENLLLILQLTGTEPYFDALVSMEDTQRGKPDPEVFLLAAGKLGVEPAHCLVIEDAPAGVSAAKAGGMKCIAVHAAGHHPEESLRNAGADRLVRSLEEVSVLVIRQILESPMAVG